MKNVKLLVILLVVGLIVPATAFADRPPAPKMGPLPISRGGTGATTAAAARTELGVSDSTSATAFVTQSIATHSADNSGQHGCTAIASATALADHEADNSSVHGCTAVASASAVALKADLNGSASERFDASIFTGGPLGYYLTNSESVTATAGSLVTVSTTSGQFALTTTGGYPDGVLYADTATNTAGYILMAGVAQNVIVPGNATSGDYVFIDSTTAGAASCTTNPPQTSTETWQYIGRCILTTTTGTTSVILNR